MIRSIRPRLSDIDENITVALDLVHNRTIKHFTNDRAFRYALQYAILIISEAVRHLPPDVTAQHPDIPWRNIAAIGNHLRHEYHRLDPDVIWNVATVHLVPLQTVIQTLLADKAVR